MTDKIKALLENAKSEEEIDAILDEHADALTDEDLEAINGGAFEILFKYALKQIKKSNSGSQAKARK